jgi:chromosome partitioning protein
VELDYDEPTIADVLADRPVAMSKVMRPTGITGLTLAPSNLRLAATAEGLYAKVKREERLSRALSRRPPGIEWIVIDCPPALGVLTANAVNAADVVIIPCQMGARALDGLEDLLDLLTLLKGEDFERWHILLTMYDPRKSVTLEIFEHMLTPYRSRLLETKIATSESLNQAQMARQDIFSYDPRGRGAHNYEQLTRELVARYHEPSA